jgi:hypothetical protein
MERCRLYDVAQTCGNSVAMIQEKYCGTLNQANTEKALDKLITLMDSGEKDDVQVRCAQTLLEYAWKLKQTEDLEKRIEFLEQSLSRLR